MGQANGPREAGLTPVGKKKKGWGSLQPGARMAPCGASTELGGKCASRLRGCRRAVRATRAARFVEQWAGTLSLPTHSFVSPHFSFYFYPTLFLLPFLGELPLLVTGVWG